MQPKIEEDDNGVRSLQLEDGVRLVWSRKIENGQAHWKIAVEVPSPACFATALEHDDIGFTVPVRH
jgi:hypothetical protein